MSGRQTETQNLSNAFRLQNQVHVTEIPEFDTAAEQLY